MMIAPQQSSTMLRIRFMALVLKKKCWWKMNCYANSKLKNDGKTRSGNAT
jgi:hypothetical protein